MFIKKSIMIKNGVLEQFIIIVLKTMRIPIENKRMKY